MEKQGSSRMCFVCGRENPVGLHAQFTTDGKRIYCDYTPPDEYQGYPGVVHGGILCALLDETIGRTCFLNGEDNWMVTAKIEMRFKAPVPIGKPLTVVGEIVCDRGRLMESRGEIRLEDGTLAMEATATYVRAPREVVERWDVEREGWKII
jgi:acyl-coenzyme A thioesterase PaaI-like protein